jgi:hypothetical protein
MVAQAAADEASGDDAQRGDRLRRIEEEMCREV